MNVLRLNFCEAVVIIKAWQMKPTSVKCLHYFLQRQDIRE